MKIVKVFLFIVLVLKISGMCIAQREYRLVSCVHYFVGENKYGDSTVYRYSGIHGSINTGKVEAQGYDSSIS